MVDLYHVNGISSSRSHALHRSTFRGVIVLNHVLRVRRIPPLASNLTAQGSYRQISRVWQTCCSNAPTRVSFTSAEFTKQTQDTSSTGQCISPNILHAGTHDSTKALFLHRLSLFGPFQTACTCTLAICSNKLQSSLLTSFSSTLARSLSLRISVSICRISTSVWLM